jgi:hypothetical protein
MRHRLRLGSRVALTGLVAIAAVAGCRTAPSASLVVAPAQAMGTVTADLGALFASLKGRHVLGAGFATNGITHVRLNAMGPGMAELNGALVPYGATGVAPTAPITLAVTAGINRNFLLEGLDAQGHVLASALSLADVPAGASLALTFNGNTNVAADVLHELLFPTETSPVAGAAPWNAQSVIGPLLAFVDRITDYDEASNEFHRVDPLAVDKPYLVSQLRANGPTWLTNTTTLPAQLSEEVWGELTIQPTQVELSNLYGISDGAITFQLFDSVSSPLSTANGAGEYRFTHIAPGHYWLKSQLQFGTDTAPVWREVEVEPAGYRRLSVYPQPKPMAPLGFAGSAPAIAGKPDGSLEFVAWRDGATIRAQRYDAARAKLGADVAVGTGATSAPMVVYGAFGGEFLVVWSNATAQTISAQRVGSDGVLKGAADTFSYAPSAAFTPVPPYAATYAAAERATDGSYVLAWTNGERVATRKLVAIAGGLSGSDGLAFVGDTAHPQDHAAIAYSASLDASLLAWARQTGTPAGKDVQVQAVSAATGLAMATPTLTASPSHTDQQSPTLVAMPATVSGTTSPPFAASQFELAWEDAEPAAGLADIRGQRFDGATNGFLYVPVSMSSGGLNKQPRLAYLPMANDRLVVVWSHQEGGSSQIMARRFQADFYAGDSRGPMMHNGTPGAMPQGAMPVPFVHVGDHSVTVLWGDPTTNTLMGSVIP